ncbi:histidine phosphatase family protein [Leptolyngbya sp. AN03gr2]|uniref:histidine phosphatase family protein n=1 Tax=unclassified Leptolyngbya TaxID=2650499 RepID=UPI003D31E8B3
MKTKVILVRHGQSTYNAEKRYQGCCDDSVLTEAGFSMASQTGALLKNTKIDAVYCSPLKRTQQSAIAILEQLESGLELNCHERLKEIVMPAWEGLPFKYVRQHLAEDYECWKERPHEFQMPHVLESTGSLATLTKAETQCFPVLDLYTQAEQFWEEILPKHSGETILIVSHGGTIRALIGTAIDSDSRSFHALQQSNCGVSVLEFSQDLHHPAQLALANSTQHLGESLPKLKAGKLGLRLLLVSDQDQNDVEQLAALIQSIQLDLCLTCDRNDLLARSLFSHRPEPVIHLRTAQSNFFEIWHRALQASSAQSASLTTGIAIASPDVIRRVLSQTLDISANPSALCLKPGAISILHYPVNHRPVLQSLNFSQSI